MDTAFDSGIIYFGTKTNNYSFQKKNSEKTIMEITKRLTHYPYKSVPINSYNNGKLTYDPNNNIVYKKQIVYSTIDDTSCHIYFKKIDTNAINFGSTNNYFYEICDVANQFIINEKIKVNITNKNYVYIEFIKDAFFDEIITKLNEIISIIHTVYTP